tara:strand:+ start:4233 stop:4433 length:201 start_codon:yes stop_codon:yes gene_type:complete
MNVDKAHDYLVQTDEDELTVEDQIQAIIEHEAKGLGTSMIDHVDGVQTVELFEYAFTCDDFLNEIS